MLPVLATVAHNSLVHLRRNLPGQIAAAESLGTEFLVVDNASTDGSLELLAEQAELHPCLRLYELPVNRGYAAGVNEALANAPGNDVMLFNPDVSITSGRSIGVLADRLAERPSVGVLAPALRWEDGSRQPSARCFPSIAAMLGSVGPIGRHIPWLEDVYASYLWPNPADRPAAVDWVIGAAMLIRRDAFDAVSGWDERYFLYMEDADFCRRVTEAGYEIQIDPVVELEHAYSRASTTPDPNASSMTARRRHVVSLLR
ncbi:MAG: glycosyltransferase, partial [Solirubrobacterales bacterium]